MYSSITLRRSLCRVSFSVWTTMPSSTRVVQEAGWPRRPSMSTRHRRQEPKASSESVAHSLGILIPAKAAACITEVPTGTSINLPSMVRLTISVWVEAGVPRSRSRTATVSFMVISVLDLGQVLLGLRGQSKILGEVFQRGQDGIRGHAAQGAQGPGEHRVAQVAQQLDMVVHVFAATDLLDGLHATRRADATGCAFATGFDGTELHGVLRHVGHVYCVVKGHQTTVADHGIDLHVGFIVQRDIPLVFGQVSAQGATDLNGTQGTTAGAATTVVVQQFAQGDAKGFFHQATVLQIAGQLEGQRATRAAHAVVLVVGTALGQNHRYGS